MIKVLTAIAAVALFYLAPWFLASTLAGGSRDAQLGAAVGIALFAVGAFWLGRYKARRVERDEAMRTVEWLDARWKR